MFDSLVSWLDAMGASTNHPLALALLAGAAVIEYVFPPFPGDTVTLLGAILVSAYDWNLALVFAVLMLGSLLGSYAAFALGRRWSRRRVQSIEEDKGRLSRLVRQFEKRGTWYLALNRFLPGIRPLFFVAAGLAGMSTRRVLMLSAISAALWNSLLMAAGAAVGNNLEQLELWLETYSKAAWTLLGIVLLILAVRRIRSLPPR